VSDAFRALEVAGWREPGRADAYDAVVGRVTARIGEPLLDAVDVRAGTSLLDVATGTGHVAGAAAARGARAAGVDVSEEMLGRARRRYPGVEFVLGDAEVLAYGDDTFDAAVAAFLLHHVPSPERVVAELARVASRVGIAQWDVGARARLIGLITDAIRAAGVEPAAGRPVGPSREQLAGDQELRRLLRQAGLAEIRTGTVAFVEPIRDCDELWNGVLGGSVNTRAIILAQPLPVRHRIRNELNALVEPYRHDQAIHVPVSVRIASGRRRGGGRAPRG
jgi:ubiquinone/menaquinone biosynthesis C-methylase UbiE